MTKWNIGCSGFHYKHWRGVFYPDDVPVRLWFQHYSKFFNTVELNVTFYRFPRLKQMEELYEKSAADFVFCSKVPKAITHFKQFNNTAQMLADYYGTLREGLKEKLGCILFQMPPRTTYNPERLQKIIDSMDPSFTNVLECRNITWWNSEAYQTLAKHGITFCGMSHPDLPQDVIQNTNVIYYRFHGVPQLYTSLYKPAVLKKFVAEIQENKKAQQVFVYFNNDIGNAAIINAKQMQRYASPAKAKAVK